MKVSPSIFRLYDIRGIFGETLSADIMQAIGQGFATYLKPKRVVVGRDVRVSGLELQTALIEGIRRLGVEVVDIGVVTSDALYFAVGKFGYDGGAIVTASHNPPEWNGVKFTRDQAIPLYGNQGIEQIRDIVMTDDYLPDAKTPGALSSFDIQPSYVEQVVSFGKFTRARKIKVVVDPGNGTVSRFLDDVMGRLPVEWSAINVEPDGNFPGRNPNPLAPGALDGLRVAVLAAKADVGVAFDADADRIFFTDEHGQRVFGDVLLALLAKQFLKQYPGSAIVYNLICSHMVPEEIIKAGGRPIRSSVGHAHMKPAMRANNALFGGEISGHYFFRDHYFADSGLDAMVAGLDFLSGQDKPLSELVKVVDIYAHDAEINSKVKDINATLSRIRAAHVENIRDEIDGLTVEYPTWWFNVRPSNTEPLLRLTVEAATPELMAEKREQLLELIRAES